jgi:GTPase SAR1 family protein
MSSLFPHCANLSEQVDRLLNLIQQESALKQQNISGVELSLSKAVAPKFEIVFAGAFSAGKSMLINALLERELLYSAEGHATGTECYIEYAEPEAEKVVLTFLSKSEINKQVINLCEHGVPCELLSPCQGWQKGKIKICLQFIPDEPRSILDNVRQELNVNGN